MVPTHLRAHIVSAEQERGDDTEVPAAARSPQKSSAFSESGSAVTIDPSARITFAESKLSTVSPCLRLSRRSRPPASVQAIPVVELMPVESPGHVPGSRRSTSASVAPGSTRTVRASASTWTVFIPLNEIIRPLPADRVARDIVPGSARSTRSAPCRPAKRTAWAASSAVRQAAMSAGRRSIIAFQSDRSAS